MTGKGKGKVSTITTAESLTWLDTKVGKQLLTAAKSALTKHYREHSAPAHITAALTKYIAIVEELSAAEKTE